jgi:hypothetical protein
MALVNFVPIQVSTTCDDAAGAGSFRMKERASFTNAVVNTAPAPIRITSRL